jgi:hypothetical protein
MFVIFDSIGVVAKVGAQLVVDGWGYDDQLDSPMAVAQGGAAVTNAPAQEYDIISNVLPPGLGAENTSIGSSQYVVGCRLYH